MPFQKVLNMRHHPKRLITYFYLGNEFEFNLYPMDSSPKQLRQLARSAIESIAPFKFMHTMTNLAYNAHITISTSRLVSKSFIVEISKEDFESIYAIISASPLYQETPTRHITGKLLDILEYALNKKQVKSIMSDSFLSK
jgi:hypothetical protein